MFKVTDTPDFGRTGLAYLAGYLRRRHGVDVRILESKLLRLGFDATVERIARFQPDVVGFTVHQRDQCRGRDGRGAAKQTWPTATTVIGGVLVTGGRRVRWDRVPRKRAEFDRGRC